MLIFRRIIRSKGSKSAKLVGGHRFATNVKALVAHAKQTRHVYAFVDEQGNEGTIRSGRVMRRVDAHVRNTLTAADIIQRPLPFDAPAETVVAPEGWTEVAA